MQNKEMQIIRLALIVLFSSLMIIYIMLYQIKGEELTNQLNTKETSISNMQTQTQQKTITSKKTTSWFFEDNKEEITGYIGTNSQNNIEDVKILSGTKLYYGEVESVDKLGLNYEYSLQDGSGRIYVKFKQEPNDLITIVRNLSGNLYTITTEQDLLQNKLFGQKVIFINIPEYKNKKVLMMIVFQKEVRMIDMEYILYHKSKGYLKSLFMNN